jgi:hypothetical protein
VVEGDIFIDPDSTPGILVYQNHSICDVKGPEMVKKLFKAEEGLL